MARSQFPLVALLATVFAPCCDLDHRASPFGDSPVDDRERASGGHIIAAVDGVPITARDLEWFMARAEQRTTADEALRALIRQELLAQEASRRGFDRHLGVDAERRRALARAILDKTVREVTEGSVPSDAVRERYEARKGRYVHGPLRRVVHAVVLTGAAGLDRLEARRAAAEIAAAVAGVADEAEFRRAVAAFEERLKKALKVETLPPFASDSAAFVREFVDAAFGAGGPASTAGPFETSFGWHVLLVLEELPAKNVSLDEARGEITAELVRSLRQARIDALLARLDRKRTVIYEAADDAVETPR